MTSFTSSIPSFWLFSKGPIYLPEIRTVVAKVYIEREEPDRDRRRSVGELLPPAEAQSFETATSFV